jgi:hypothetical protein
VTSDPHKVFCCEARLQDRDFVVERTVRVVFEQESMTRSGPLHGPYLYSYEGRIGVLYSLRGYHIRKEDAVLLVARTLGLRVMSGTTALKWMTKLAPDRVGRCMKALDSLPRFSVGKTVHNSWFTKRSVAQAVRRIIGDERITCVVCEKKYRTEADWIRNICSEVQWGRARKLVSAHVCSVTCLIEDEKCQQQQRVERQRKREELAPWRTANRQLKEARKLLRKILHGR